MLMAPSRTERRMQSAERTIERARVRVVALRRRLSNSVAMANAKASREIEREFGTFSQGWGRTFRVRIKPAQITAGGGKRISTVSKTRRPRKSLKAYKAPLVDRRGRVAVYMRIRYVGFKSKGWRAGLAAEHSLYILREDALELAGAQSAIITNMGKTAAEVAAGWKALETIEEGYRANAIVQYRMVLNLPADLTTQQRRQVVQEFSERSFGRLGLPYVAAVHKPDPAGDQRNWHAHICFSTRPTERIGEGEWAISEEKVNGLTDPAGLLRLRAQASAHLNLACHNAGLNVRYTHQSYQDRGIDAERQGHVGPAAMAAYDRGEHVAVIERNAAIVERNETAVEFANASREVEVAAYEVERMRGLLELVTQRRDIQKLRLRVQAIGDRARSIILQQSKPAVVERSQIQMIRARSAEIRQALEQKQELQQTINVPQVWAIGLKAKNIVAGLQKAVASRAALISATQHLNAVKRLVADRQSQLDVQRRADVHALITKSAVRPYRIENARICLDLSAMLLAETALIRSVDAETLKAALRQRFFEDRAADAEAERTRQAEMKAQADRLDAQRKRAEETRLEIKEACRILDQAGARPYRMVGGMAVPDLSALTSEERQKVERVGAMSGAVGDALQERAERDRRADELHNVRGLADALGKAVEANKLAAISAAAISPADQASEEFKRSLSASFGDVMQKRQAAMPMTGEQDTADPTYRDKVAKDLEAERHRRRMAHSAGTVAVNAPRSAQVGPSAKMQAPQHSGEPLRAIGELSASEKEAVDALVENIAETGDFIFNVDDRLRVSPQAAASLGVNDLFFEHAHVQERLKPLFDRQQHDVAVVIDHLIDQPHQFDFVPGNAGFTRDAPQAVIAAFERRDTPEFQRLLAQMIEADADLKDRLRQSAYGETEARPSPLVPKPTTDSARKGLLARAAAIREEEMAKWNGIRPVDSGLRNQAAPNKSVSPPAETSTDQRPSEPHRQPWPGNLGNSRGPGR